jgi:hypothetical protein
MSRPTFDDLAALEPRLARLLAEAQECRLRRGRRLDVTAVFYSYGRHRPGFKRRLSELVGWASGREGVLGSSEAYEVVYRVVYQALAGGK